MLAIHNYIAHYCIIRKAANAFAKLSKCQQFTTNISEILVITLLQTLMQSYQNVSNSQRWCVRVSEFAGCKRLCKVIKMLAIHNLYQTRRQRRLVANAYAKLSKCQQFTTLYYFSFLYFLLQTLMQSYQNVSNSQLLKVEKVIGSSCKRLCKVIKMLAIHNQSNCDLKPFGVANAYAKLSKCQQFTTMVRSSVRICRLQTLMQSYQNVSNSQPLQAHLEATYSCKSLCKVIKMLAIHNFIKSFKVLSFVANAYAKLSKCQQFTTERYFSISIPQLQTLMQSYQNVSNSQLQLILQFFKLCCKRLCKVIKMLAIHN